MACNAVALLLTQTIRKFTHMSSTHANMMRLLRSLLPIITVKTGNQPPLHAKPQHIVGHATFYLLWQLSCRPHEACHRLCGLYTPHPLPELYHQAGKEPAPNGRFPTCSPLLLF